MSKTTIGIVSYCNFVRTYASVNHHFYAEQHGYTYIYDIAPTRHNVFKNKIEKLIKFLPLFDWLFWIDDDAFFLQYSEPLEQFIDKRFDLIFCESPVNEGMTTYLSSGNFFLKNTPKTMAFLHACLAGDLEKTRSSWRDEFGLFTNGDQDIMVDLLHSDARFNGKRFHTRLPYTAFNTRPFHFDESSRDHFLVHFTGSNKQDQAVRFAEKYTLSPALIPKDEFAQYFGVYPVLTNASPSSDTHYL